jgi:hypothetical protein
VRRNVAQVRKSLPVLLYPAKKNLMHHDKISPPLAGVETAGEKRTGVTGEREAGSGAIGAGETAMVVGVGRERSPERHSTVGEQLLFQKGFREIDRRVGWDLEKNLESRVAIVDEFRSL